MTETDNSPKVRIAIVGMAGAGKTVLISALAMKMSQMADQGLFLAPVGETRRQTLRYVQTNWETLNSGQWPPSTPAGELIHLEWELNTKKNVALTRFTDCAGQDIRTIFSRENFNVRHLPADLFDTFVYLNNANILIFLVNMEDLLGKSGRERVENALDIDQMIYVLNKKPQFPRRVAIVFSQYDKYKPEVDIQYGGDLMEYLRVNLPQLHGAYYQKGNFEIIPVAAVNKTRRVIIDGEVKQIPEQGFDSYNLDQLIWWIGEKVDELAAMPVQPPLPPPEWSRAPSDQSISYNTMDTTNEQQDSRPEHDLIKKLKLFMKNTVLPLFSGCGCGCFSFIIVFFTLVIILSVTDLTSSESGLVSFIIAAACMIVFFLKGYGKAIDRNRAAALKEKNRTVDALDSDLSSSDNQEEEPEFEATTGDRATSGCSLGCLTGFLVFFGVSCLLIGESGEEPFWGILLTTLSAVAIGFCTGWSNPPNNK